MSLLSNIAYAGEAPVATSPVTAAAQPSFIETMLPFLLLFVVMYFVMIRPQAKKAKDHATTLAQLKPGDEIVTTGGIIARVKSIHPTFILIDTGHHSMKLLKEHVARLSKDLTGVTAPGK